MCSIPSPRSNLEVFGIVGQIASASSLLRQSPIDVVHFVDAVQPDCRMSPLVQRDHCRAPPPPARRQSALHHPMTVQPVLVHTLLVHDDVRTAATGEAPC